MQIEITYRPDWTLKDYVEQLSGRHPDGFVGLESRDDITRLHYLDRRPGPDEVPMTLRVEVIGGALQRVRISRA